MHLIILYPKADIFYVAALWGYSNNSRFFFALYALPAFFKENLCELSKKNAAAHVTRLTQFILKKIEANKQRVECISSISASF